MANNVDNLYQLMPAIHRERDAQQNYSLRALLQILASQGALVDKDIQQLYENLFIETCQDWVIPYIGDLVSNNLLYDGSRATAPDTAKSLFPDLAGKNLLPPIAIRIRADVAKTIYFRRRKSTPAMLEELARDVSEWPAHVSEFFQLLGWNQFLEHLRFQCVWTDLHSIDRMERIYGPFDESSHTVDVRQPAQQDGWHNIRNIGVFLWRLQSFPLDQVPARQATQPWQYHFSPLGNRAPLFTRARDLKQNCGRVAEIDVPAAIRRQLFFNDLENYRNTPPPRLNSTELYGEFDLLSTDPASVPETSFFVALNGQGIDPSQDPNAPPATFVPQIVCMQLDPWPGTQPKGRIIGIDGKSGRIAVGDGWPATGPVDVSYFYGFSAGLGGGSYDRAKWLVNRFVNPQAPKKPYKVLQSGGTGVFTSVIAAITQWQTDQRPDAVISILDSRTYALPALITLRNEAGLAIEAANQQRPLLQTTGSGLQVDVSPPADPQAVDRNAVFTISGSIVEGFLDVIGDLGALRLFHSTLVPGRLLNEDGTPAGIDASVIVHANSGSSKPINQQLRLEAAFSILGQIEAPETAAGIWLLDCILQGVNGVAISSASGGGASAVLTTERSTFFGTVQVKSMNASETIFTAKVTAQRTQEGCVRFSYVVPNSTSPRRYRCQPDVAIAEAIEAAKQSNPGLTALEQAQITQFIQAWLVPSFTTTLYGQPAFAQLHLACPREIRTGAEDSSEMGAFCHLKQSQRESNLKIRLQEYLPFGLEAGMIYVT
jgi:hypothetical protein